MAGPAHYSGTMNIAKNEDWVVQFIYGSIGPDGGDFAPIDLVGSKLMLELRIRERDHEALVSVYSPDGGIVIDGLGRFTIIITRDQLRRLSAGEYVTDLVREMPNGYRERIWEGIATVVTGTTR